MSLMLIYIGKKTPFFHPTPPYLSVRTVIKIYFSIELCSSLESPTKDGVGLSEDMKTYHLSLSTT